MIINGVEIEDNFAEAFGIKVSRILITAATKKLALVAATEATGYGTISYCCPAEAGIDGTYLHRRHQMVGRVYDNHRSAT